MAPAIKINGGAAGVKASVSAGGAISATLEDISGVRTVAWEISSTDETTAAATYTLVQSGSVGQTVATTALTAGTAALLKVTTYDGLNRESATAKFYVPTAGGYEVGCAGEEYESNATFGSTGILNSVVRTAGAGTYVPGAGLTESPAGTFNVVANADASIVVNANDIQVGVLASDAQHGNRGGGGVHANAVASGAAGFMSGTDKAKLDGLPTSAVASTRTLTAGAGLTGGGDLSSDRTFNVATADASITVNADSIEASGTFGAKSISQTGATSITAGSGGFVGVKLDYAGALVVGGVDATSIGIGSASITTTITGVAVIRKDAIGSSDITGLLLDNTTSGGSSEERPPVIQQGGYGHKTGGGGSQVKCYATRRVRLQDGASNPDIEVYEQYDLGGSVGVFGTWTTNLPGISGTGLYLNSTLVLGGASNGVRGSGGGNPGLAFTGGWDVQIKASSTDFHVVLGAAQTERRSFDYSTPTNNYTAYAADVQTTTDATPTNVWTYAMPDNSSVIFDVDVYCYDTATPTLRAYFGKRAFLNRNGGAPTLDSSQDKYTDVVVGAWGSPPAAVIAVGPGANDVSVKTTGLLAQNIKWITKITYHVATTSA